LQLLATPLAHAGDTAPGFSLAGIDSQVNLADKKGKVVYLDFWASWCTPCRQSFPWMNQLKARYAAQGLEIIAVNLDKTREDSKAFIDATQPTFTIAFDPEGSTAEAYQVMGMPSSYLIDRTGQLHHSHIGFRDRDRATLESQIEELLQQ
jgi:thiol-disulfide isomerase/thioredoxin